MEGKGNKSLEKYDICTYFRIVMQKLLAFSKKNSEATLQKQ